jgi:hypothetical protein
MKRFLSIFPPFLIGILRFISPNQRNPRKIPWAFLPGRTPNPGSDNTVASFWMRKNFPYEAPAI